LLVALALIHQHLGHRQSLSLLQSQTALRRISILFQPIQMPPKIPLTATITLSYHQGFQLNSGLITRTLLLAQSSIQPAKIFSPGHAHQLCTRSQPCQIILMVCETNSSSRLTLRSTRTQPALPTCTSHCSDSSTPLIFRPPVGPVNFFR